MTIPQVLEANTRLAQSSAYRNLVVLEAAGVVTRIVTNDDFARYELAEHLTHHHHHLICSSCGDVADFALDDQAEAGLDKALHKSLRRPASPSRPIASTLSVSVPTATERSS